MEEDSSVQKLTLKDFEGIELDPNGFQIDYLAAIAKRALEILERDEKHMKKRDDVKRKFSDSDQIKDEQQRHWKKELDDRKRDQSRDLDHLDEQPKKKKKDSEEMNKETLDQPRFSSEISKTMCMKKGSETEIKRSEQRRERLRREKLLKKPVDDDYDEIQEQKKMKKCKNVKKSDNIIVGPPPDIPREFMEALERFAEGKTIEEPKLILQKSLFKTDISEGQNRLSLPVRHLLHEFLTKEEISELEKHVGKNVKTIETYIIEPSLQKGDISFRRWEMKKETGNSSIMYVLSGTWNKIVSRNSLRQGQVVQIWSTRVDGKLWFLLVRVPSRGLRTTISSVSKTPGNEDEVAGPSVPPLDPSNDPGPSSSSLDPSNEPGPSSSKPDQNLHGHDYFNDI